MTIKYPEIYFIYHVACRLNVRVHQLMETNNPKCPEKVEIYSNQMPLKETKPKKEEKNKLSHSVLSQFTFQLLFPWCVCAWF